jgi:hypothetical protein
VAMIPIRFFTDEDVWFQVALDLRAAGFDAVSAAEAIRIGHDDPGQLGRATNSGRALVTFNVGDFARLHHVWMRERRHHWGVIVSQQRPIGELSRRLLNLARNRTAEELRDRLEFLSNWPPV